MLIETELEMKFITYALIQTLTAAYKATSVCIQLLFASDIVQECVCVFGSMAGIAHALIHYVVTVMWATHFFFFFFPQSHSQLFSLSKTNALQLILYAWILSS